MTDPRRNRSRGKEEFRGPAATDSSSRHLLWTFLYLASTQGMTAILGLAYWPISTRFFPARDVGIAAAAMSAASFLGIVGVMGIATLLVAEIRSVDPREQRMATSTGMLIAGGFVLVLSIGTWGLSPLLGKSLRSMGGQPLIALLFVVGSAASVAATAFDNAALGLRRGRVRFVRPVLASVLKLVIIGVLLFAGVRSASGLVFAWSAGMVVSLAVGWWMIRFDRPARGESRLRHRFDLMRRYRVLAFQHHALNLSMSSVSYAMQVVAAMLVLPTELAYFATAQVVSAVVMLVPYLFAYALFAETANDEELLHRHIRRTLPASLAVCAGIIVIVELTAPTALRIFGDAYAHHSATVLRLLVLSGIPYVLKDHYVAVRRAEGALVQASKVLAVATVGETMAGIAGGLVWGVNGLALGWAAGATIEAFCLGPTVMRAYLVPVRARVERREAAT